MSGDNLAAEVGRAWRSQRGGKADAAIGEYERILQQDNDNIDANYGMGLAQRDAGKKDQALQYFQRTLSLIEAAITAHPKAPSDPNTQEDDRRMMLARMTRQRIAELNK